MPEIKGFRFKVEVRLQITRSELDHMIECSQAHYDWKCKAASQQGGFLYGWRNMFELDEPGIKTLEVQANWDTVDTLCKMLEGEQYMRHLAPEKSLYFSMRRVLVRMREESERVNAEKE